MHIHSFKTLAMADAQLHIIHPQRAVDRKIPVFTVLKNNAILKNILLLRAPPEMHNPAGGDIRSPGDSNNPSRENEMEEILTVGRHPNCSIVLSHPSISRFHLQIRSKPSSRKLSVTDLSSVQGTWVSGKRIKPRDCVELDEGDELRLGGSSRVYKLHWVSLCQAYDLDHPFFPASDVSMSDDIEKIEEEAIFQNETGLQADDDVSSNSEEKTVLVSCEDEVPLQKSIRNDYMLKGILKHRQEYSPCMIKPLSFPLPDGEIMAAAEVGELDLEKQFKNAPAFSEMASGRRIEGSQMVDYDDLVPLARNFSENHKQLCPLPDSYIEQLLIESQISEVPMDAVVLQASEESPSALSEKHFHHAEDQTKMPVDSSKRFSESKDEESSFIEKEKGIIQSVIGSQTPMLELTPRELFAAGNMERLDAMLVDICDVENKIPKSPPMTTEVTINRESSDETQHFNLERAFTECVSDRKSIHHESDVKPEEKIRQSEIESLPPERLREEYVVIKSGNGQLVSDSGIQILEPLLDAFLFLEKNIKESCGFKSVQTDLESQSPETPFYVKCIPYNGNEKGSKTVSNQRSNVTKVSSQRCQPLGTLQILTCSSKGKRRGSTTIARTQLHNSNGHEKSVSKSFLAELDHGEDEYEICTPDKEDFALNTLLKSMKKMGILDDFEVNSSMSDTSRSQNVSSSPQKPTSKALLADLDNEEYPVEMYTPDKENFTPNTRLLKSMKTMGLLDENKIKSSVSDKSRSSKVSSTPSLMQQYYYTALEKENETPFFVQEQSWPTVKDQAGNKKSVSWQRKAKRIPLQSLSINSSRRSKPDTSVYKVATRSRGSVTRAQFQKKTSPKNNNALEAKVKWYIVVDSTCFVHSESRKALQLLQGIRGTKLIVPGTVLRELDAMNQNASLFCRTTEVSAALKWLEDCFVNTKWWINVQSSFEEVRHLAPTPPVSPKLHDSTHHAGNKSWKTFPIFRKFLDAPSPKAEDHILEYAVQQMMSITDNGRIAILSNDTALRIKAMAEGLVCETATEFRDSLVNPFSERFLWSESSPRGRTWSCQDDIVLREQFYSQHSKNPEKKGHDTIKGLKLIMAYNSRDNNKALNLQWR